MDDTNVKWPDGFLFGSSRTGLPSRKDSEEMSSSQHRMPYPLNLHINSIFQFYFVPLKQLIELNGPNIKKKAIPTIWFSGYREMQALFPVDFKFWCFSGKKGIYSVLRILALLKLYFVFFNYFKLIVLKMGRTSELDVDNLLLIRRPTHLSSYSNPFYKELVENSTKVLFFDPKRKLGKDEVFAPLSFRMLFKALYNCSSSICKAIMTSCHIEVSDIELDLKSANIEACFHFETFLYAEQLKKISDFKVKSIIFSFEQVSSSAELEKTIFLKHDLHHIQFGIIPYYPFPTIGLGSTFLIRSKNVLKSYSTNLIGRNFKKLGIDKKLFSNIQYDAQQNPCFIFATQPYRKKQESYMLEMLSHENISNNILIKYHPRESELYSNFSTVKDVFSIKNSVVITRTSSFTVELFARGIPYACYIDAKDLDLDQGEVSGAEDPVSFSDINELIMTVKNIDNYIQSFKDWRDIKLKDYLDV